MNSATINEFLGWIEIVLHCTGELKGQQKHCKLQSASKWNDSGIILPIPTLLAEFNLTLNINQKSVRETIFFPTIVMFETAQRGLIVLRKFFGAVQLHNKVVSTNLKQRHCDRLHIDSTDTCCAFLIHRCDRK